MADSPESRLPFDYFDPEGAEELRRTFTGHSSRLTRTQSVARNNVNAPSGSSSLRTAVPESDWGNFDLEKHLQGLLQRQEEADIKRRALGVAFRDLHVTGLGADASYQTTFGSLFNPTHLLDSIRHLRHPPVKDILSGFEGVVQPGEMLLVLGRPGSGCTSLLKTLANQTGSFRSVEGTVAFSAFTPDEIRKHYRGDVIYCPEDDEHFPTLTVEETLRFAARTRAPRSGIAPGLKAEDCVEEIVDVLTTVFGLRHVRKTVVGDAAIRGVSGGEKKRVSIAEALASRSKIGAWDNSTRGLDASTALEFVRALRIATDAFELATIVSIYQASENLYELFDKVCVISEGKMMYYGKAREARQYFIDMGYEPANRQTTSDFLVAVTDPNGRTAREGFERQVPYTADEMAAYFRRHPFSKTNSEEVDRFFAEHQHDQSAQAQEKGLYKESARAEHSKHSRKGSPYVLSVPAQVREVIKRRVQIIKGDLTTQIIQLCSFIFQGIIMGTIFLKVADATSAYFSRGGVLFFALLFGSLSALAEIPALYAQRPIVQRHQRAAMYHPFSEALALTIVDIPITFITIVVFVTILYELVQLQQTAGQFFIFFLYVFTTTIVMKAYFRTLAAAFPREPVAQALAGVSILLFLLYTGYVIPRPSMIGALKWITYINPIRYSFEGIISNEFHTLNGTCSTLVPHGPGYEGITLANQVCTTVGSQTGQMNVDGNTFIGLSYGYSYSHLWRNYGVLVAFGIGFIVLLLFFTEIGSTGAPDVAMILFKRGTTKRIANLENSDEEKGVVRDGPIAVNVKAARKKDEADAIEESALEQEVSTTDIFSWQHLNYTVPVSGGSTRKLLDDVSGFVAPGKLTALMGESGAGKTTLLNVLAQRAGTGVVTGDRFVNGQPLPKDFQAQTGYVQQTDTHLPEMTVREALRFSAILRQPASVPLSEKNEYVETCLRMCGLEDFADAIVGSLGVEHKKRTTIAVELAAKPKLLLFLDEPTSGLDSQSAWAIVQFLRSLADHGQAILCTIHQPSSELFQVFDRLLLLRKGGQSVYFGDIGENSSTMIRYFEKNGARKCGELENPAEWMLDIIGAGATATSTTDWRDVWMNSDDAQRAEDEIERIVSEGRKKPALEVTRRSEFATSWGHQLYVLLERALISYWRNPNYIVAKLFLNIAAGLLIGFTYFKSKDSMQGTQNKIFAVFLANILSVPLSNQLQVVFIDFRNIYEVRERPSRMYSWTALLASQLLVELPWNFMGANLFFFCWFWTVGFPSDRAGYTYFTYTIVFVLYYTTISQAVAAMSPNAVIASVLFSAIYSFVIAFNGVLQPYSQLGWWKWMYRVSPQTYVIEGLVGQAVGKELVNCAPKELVTLQPPSGQTCGAFMDNFISASGGYLTNPNSTSDCQYCSSRTTDQFLQTSFNIFYSHHWRNVGIVLGVTVFNIFLIVAITYLFRIRSRNIFAPLIDRIRRKN